MSECPKLTKQISSSSKKLVEWSGGQGIACSNQVKDQHSNLIQGTVKPVKAGDLPQLAKGIKAPPDGRSLLTKGNQPIPEIVIDHCLACQSDHVKNVMRGPPHIPITINRVTIMAIVDTGADRTLCQSKIAERIYGCRWKQQLKVSTVKLKSATGHALKVKGEIEMVMEIGEMKVKHSVVIVDDAIAPFLLGQDFMLDKVILEDGRYFLLHDDEKGVEKIPITYNIKEYVVRTVQNERIPPLSSRLIRGLIRMNNRQTEDEQESFDDLIGVNVYLSARLPSFDSQEDIEYIESVGVYVDSYLPYRMEDTVSTVEENNYVTCLMTNLTEEVVTIEAKEIIGRLQLVEETEEKGILHVVGEEADCTITEEDILFLHEEETKEAIFVGETEDRKILPKGYEAEEIKPKVKITVDHLINLTEKQRNQVKLVLWENQKVFSQGPGDFGKTHLMEFEIDTGDHEPVQSRYVPVPAHYEKELKVILDQMVDNKILEECESSWNNTIVIVKKPGGKLRLCVNLKNVNSLTLNKSSFPINYQEQSLAKLCNAKYYFRLDLSQAYYAIPLKESSRDKTAFSALGKQYRFLTSPFGAKYLPSKFSKLMSIIFRGMDSKVFFYFDDIIASSNDFQELMATLKETLGRLLKAGMRVNFEKSDFCLTSLEPIKWLGAIIKDNHMFPDPKKINSILEMQLPRTKKGMMRFLGAISYHRRHLPHLAEILAPLYKLCSTKAQYLITDKETQAFNLAKRLITSAASLKLPDLSKRFIVTCDASNIGVGGVLSQLSDTGEEQIVAYCSRVLTDTESKGSSCEKELIAILYTIGVFYYYLAHNKFLLRTDSKSLIYLKHFKGINNKLLKTSNILNELDFDIEHYAMRKGNVMAIADLLSRCGVEDIPEGQKASYKELRKPIYDQFRKPDGLPEGPMSKEVFETYAEAYLKEFWEDKDQQVINSMFLSDRHCPVDVESLLQNKQDTEDFILYINQPRKHVKNKYGDMGSGRIYTVVTDETHYARIDEDPDAGRILQAVLYSCLFTKEAFLKAQVSDLVIGALMIFLHGQPANERYNGYFLRKGFLYRDVADIPTKCALVIPKDLVQTIMNHYHSNSGNGPHIGRKRLYENIRYAYYWKGMHSDIKKFAEECVPCQFNTVNTDPQYVMQRRYVPQRPNEAINIDIVGPFLRAADGSQYLLTMQCDFTKFALAIPIKTKSAEVVARTLLLHWISVFGKPKYIRSDVGTDTDSAIMQFICKSLLIEKLRTSIYSPANNPIERWHGVLVQTLRTWLPNAETHKYWPLIIPFVCLSYNYSVHTVTRQKPIELFMGPRKENYLIPVIPDDDPAMDRYTLLKEVTLAQKIYWALAKERLQRHREEVNKVEKLGRHDQPYQYEVGQHVLLRNFVPKSKLDPRYVGPYTIVKVERNALTIVHWQDAKRLLELNKLRRFHEPNEMGRIVQRTVHPKDVKPYNQLPKLTPTWDEILAKKFFKYLQLQPGEQKEGEEDEDELSEPEEEQDLIMDQSFQSLDPREEMPRMIEEDLGGNQAQIKETLDNLVQELGTGFNRERLTDVARSFLNKLTPEQRERVQQLRLSQIFDEQNQGIEIAKGLELIKRLADTSGTDKELYEYVQGLFFEGEITHPKHHREKEYIQTKEWILGKEQSWDIYHDSEEEVQQTEDPEELPQQIEEETPLQYDKFQENLLEKRKGNPFQVSTPREPLTTSRILPRGPEFERGVTKAKELLKDLPLQIEGGVENVRWNYEVAYPEKGEEHIRKCTSVGVLHYASQKLITLDEELTEEQEAAIWFLKLNKYVLTYMPTLGKWDDEEPKESTEDLGDDVLKDLRTEEDSQEQVHVDVVDENPEEPERQQENDNRSIGSETTTVQFDSNTQIALIGDSFRDKLIESILETPKTKLEIEKLIISPELQQLLEKNQLLVEQEKALRRKNWVIPEYSQFLTQTPLVEEQDENSDQIKLISARLAGSRLLVEKSTLLADKLKNYRHGDSQMGDLFLTKGVINESNELIIRPQLDPLATRDLTTLKRFGYTVRYVHKPEYEQLTFAQLFQWIEEEKPNFVNEMFVYHKDTLSLARIYLGLRKAKSTPTEQNQIQDLEQQFLSSLSQLSTTMDNFYEAHRNLLVKGPIPLRMGLFFENGEFKFEEQVYHIHQLGINVEDHKITLEEKIPSVEKFAVMVRKFIDQSCQMRKKIQKELVLMQKLYGDANKKVASKEESLQLEHLRIQLISSIKQAQTMN